MHMTTHFPLATLLVAGALVAASCNRSPRHVASSDSLASALPPGHVPIPASPRGATLTTVSQALLDSGNVAFRAKKYDAALAFYSKASSATPQHAAPWFGTYMVAKAIGNTQLADSALRMVKARAPDIQAHPITSPPASDKPFNPHAAGTGVTRGTS